MIRALLQTFIVGIFATTLSPAFAQCAAIRDCGGGTSVQCQGTTSCQALSNGVDCDGTQRTCSPPPGAACYIDYYCPNGFIFSCSGTNACSTNTTSQTITCDETTPSGYPGGVKVGNLTTYYCSYCDSHPNECDSAGW
jgi:hypothetical protein